MHKGFTAAVLAGALAALSIAPAAAQDDRCTGGNTPGGVFIVQFDTGQSTITPRAKQELAGFASRAIGQKATRLCLDGYADARLGHEDDLLLAKARAEAVGNELVANGYPRERIFINKIIDPKRVFGRRETSTERKVEVRYGR
ncbi:MAG: OmpA family protein [Rhodospirillales bacterium]|nr:MAG: OmpA family protein [Rhodospirillales bacterium]